MAATQTQGRAALFLLLAFVVIEGPYRMLTATDPWLVDGSHWYFAQPLRLALDVLLVAAAAGCLWVWGPRDVLSLKFTRRQWLWTGGGLAVLAALILWRMGGNFAAFAPAVPLGSALLWFITGFLIGMGQEITFRGLLFEGLRAYVRRSYAIILSVLIFVIAPLHSYRLIIYGMEGQEGRALFLMAIYLVAGILFMWIRIMTRSVIVPGILHGTVNGLTWMMTFSVVALAA